MLKLCLMILSLLFLVDVPYANDNNFDEDVHKAYEIYEQYYTSVANDNFHLRIVRGKVNEKLCYGICFTNAYAKTYCIELVDEDGVKYTLSQDKRGDINAVAIDEISKAYTINVYKDSEKINLFLKAELVPFTEEDLSNSNIVSLNYGENQGCKFSNLKVIKTFSLNFSQTFLLITGGITLVCIIIIVVFYKREKGMFNKEKRKEGVFNFKEFLNTDYEETPKSEFDIIDLEPSKEDGEEEKEIYEKRISYEEERTNFPLKEYLQDKGFITDYKIAQEEEKQKIMLELMKLRDDKKISEDEYLEEAYRLWKE